jgi:hypothetical protein
MGNDLLFLATIPTRKLITKWKWHILNIYYRDEGYSERTWWKLFWAYLMKVIPETRLEH